MDGDTKTAVDSKVPKFSKEVRQILERAREEATRLGHNLVGPEHILLALIQDNGAAASMLQSMNVDLAQVREQTEQSLPRGDSVGLSGELPYTRGAKSVVELAISEASRMSLDRVGPEHLLLGLLADSDNPATQVLSSLGATVDAGRERAERFSHREPLVSETAVDSRSPDLRRDFSVIIPAYNEKDNVAELFKEIEATFLKHQLDGEVILVDDGSDDGTGDTARREGARLRRFRLVRHPRNLGKTEALLSGARVAEGDWLILFDADLQHSPEEFPRLLHAADHGYDIVCGRKIGRYQKPLVSGVYNWLARRLFRVPARDLNSIKIFQKRILDEIHLRHDWHRYFVILAHARGYRVSEIEVRLYPRRRGTTKYGGRGRILVGLLDLVAVWFLLLFSRKPMLLFGFTGLALLTLAFVVGVAAIGMRVLGHGFRPLLTLVSLLGVMGISLFGFGLLAELVAALRDEVDELRDSMRRLRGRV